MTNFFQCKMYSFTVILFLYYRPANTLSLSTLTWKISTLYDINFRILVQNRSSSIILNFNSNFQHGVITSPITISHHLQDNATWQDNDQGVDREAFFYSPPKRHALQNIKIFITLTHNMQDLSNVIIKSGHSSGNNYNVMLYNIAHWRSSFSQEIFHQGIDIPKLGFTCHLTFITWTSRNNDNLNVIAIAHQLCYLCPAKNSLIRLGKLEFLHDFPSVSREIVFERVWR